VSERRLLNPLPENIRQAQIDENKPSNVKLPAPLSDYRANLWTPWLVEPIDLNYDYDIPPNQSPPESQWNDLLESQLAKRPQMKSTIFPYYKRYMVNPTTSFTSLTEFIQGHTLDIKNMPNPNSAGKRILRYRGIRWAYGIQVPMMDRSTNTSRLNFYPAPGVKIDPIVQLSPTDTRFFTVV